MSAHVPRHRYRRRPRGRIAAGLAAAAVTIVTVSAAAGVWSPVALGEPGRRLDTPPVPSQQAATADGGGAGAGDGSGAQGTASTDVAPTPTPGVPARSGHGKRVVFDMSDQRVWLVDADGDLVRTYLVSGSKHDNLDPGHYEVFSRSKDAVSYNHRETMRFMVRFASGQRAAIGFHDIPLDAKGHQVQTRDQLGTPLSAGCIRQWKPDAKALWKFAPVGTPVVVLA